MKRTWILGTLATALTLPAASFAQVVPVTPQPAQQPAQVQQPARTTQPAPATRQAGRQQQQQPNPADRARLEAETARIAAGDLPGPIDSLRDIRDTARLAFMIADANGDHMVSQEEAIDAGNTLVGGFFFAADTNGDGTLSQDEAKAAREKVERQHPILKFVVRRAQQSDVTPNVSSDDNQSPNVAIVRQVGALLDGNGDKKLQANEIRDAVKTAVQALYTQADSDRDGQMSVAEVNQASYNALRELPRMAFMAMDQNGNGSLTKDEVAQAVVEPAKLVFDILDKNQDGELTQDELQSAGEVVVRELESLDLPEPANSPANILSSEIGNNR